MDHDALAQLFGIIATVCLAVVGLLYKTFRAEIKEQLKTLEDNVGVLEKNQKMVLLAIYHLALGQQLPDHVREEIERRILNGKK